MSGELFDEFQWHSSIGMDALLEGRKRFAVSLPNTRRARAMFVAGGNDTLIHKTTRALWRVSDDKTCIVPMFSTDILTEDELREAMKEYPDESH